jgi:glycosyltransferase involved in cell wall biosynthesis
MRILLASPFLPWPLIEGGRVAQYRTFAALREACSFVLVVPIYSLKEEIDAQEFAALFPNIKVRTVRCFQHDPPFTLRTAVRRLGGKLLRKLLRPQRLEKPAEVVPYYPFCCLNPDFVVAVEAELANGCDIFQAEFADMLSLGPLMAGRIPSVFIHHQLHYVYARRFIEANEGAGINARYVTEKIVREELAYLETFDATVVFSEVDRASLESLCPAIKVHVSPFPSPEDPTFTAHPFDKPATRFVFVGSEAHHPNADGLSWFMKHVWPVIQTSLPSSSVEVIGKWSLSAQTALPNYQGIIFSGFVPELLEALQNKIMIVPLWIGSGIRTKILAALSACCPVVTTTIGVEGLPGHPAEHFIVADDARSFASACIELSQNLEALNRIASNGLDLVQKFYSLEAVRRTRLDIYESLLAAGQHPKSYPCSKPAIKAG